MLHRPGQQVVKRLPVLQASIGSIPPSSHQSSSVRTSFHVLQLAMN
jgi:hypothetical protein